VLEVVLEAVLEVELVEAPPEDVLAEFAALLLSALDDAAPEEALPFDVGVDVCVPLPYATVAAPEG
jgi:hypothetical protein